MFFGTQWVEHSVSQQVKNKFFTNVHSGKELLMAHEKQTHLVLVLNSQFNAALEFNIF